LVVLFGLLGPARLLFVPDVLKSSDDLSALALDHSETLRQLGSADFHSFSCSHTAVLGLRKPARDLPARCRVTTTNVLDQPQK
jgi:hypothetical protein